MHYIGIDIAKDTHYVAVVDADEQIVVRGRPFKEDANGYAKLIALIEPLADSAETLVVMEATGHYWQNLSASSSARATLWPSSTPFAATTSPRKTCGAQRRMQPMP